MSMPNIPNIKPDISLNRCETVNLLLSSIALEEIGLSHILNAEGEKLQAMLKKDPKCIKGYMDMNKSINKTLRTIIKSQMLLQLKLEDVMELDEEICCSHNKKCSCKNKCSGCKRLDCHCKEYNKCPDSKD